MLSMDCVYECVDDSACVCERERAFVSTWPVITPI